MDRPIRSAAAEVEKLARDYRPGVEVELPELSWLGKLLFKGRTVKVKPLGAKVRPLR